MSPISNRMRVDPPSESLALHLIQTSLQDVISRSPDLHVVLHDILEAIRLLQPINQTLGDILLGLAWVENICKVLSIGVKPHSCDAKVHVQEIAILNSAEVDRCLLRRHFEDAFGPDNIDVALEPGGVVI